MNNNLLENFHHLLRMFRKKVCSQFELKELVEMYSQIYHHRLSMANTEERIQFDKLCRIIKENKIDEKNESTGLNFTGANL